MKKNIMSLDAQGPMALDSGIRFEAGDIQGMIYGGTYYDFVPGTRRLAGVKMAAEINRPCDISIPTEDFNVPSQDAMQSGVLAAINALSCGQDIYAGCMGGVGRTGLFMACMAKVMIAYHGGTYEAFTDPVKYVRKYYRTHAVERPVQHKFIDQFDTEPALKLIESLDRHALADQAIVLRKQLDHLRAHPIMKQVEVMIDRPIIPPYRPMWHRFLFPWVTDIDA